MLGIVAVVDRRAMKLGQAGGDAPGEHGHVQLGSDVKHQLFQALLFGGLDGNDRMARINEQAQFVVLIGVRRNASGKGSHG